MQNTVRGSRNMFLNVAVFLGKYPWWDLPLVELQAKSSNVTNKDSATSVFSADFPQIF